MPNTSDQEKNESSILRKNINICDEGPSSCELESLCRQIGHQWPPRDQAEAVAVLKKAGFAGQRIDQFLHHMGYPGFDGVGEMPRGYMNAGEPAFRERMLTPAELSKEFGVPTFTPMLIEGLKDHILKQKLVAAGDSITLDEDGPCGLILNIETRSATRQGFSKFSVLLEMKFDQWALLLLLKKHTSLTKKQVMNQLGLEPESAKKLRQRFNESFSCLNIKITREPWALAEDSRE